MAGICSTGFIPADAPTATQVPGDCKQTVCDGNGGIIDGDDDTDVPTDNEVCTVDSCFDGTPVHMPAAKGLDCMAQGPAPKRFCGDPRGPNAGKCVECIEEEITCLGAKTCIDNVCQ
jgi:hypothetical protein